MVLHQPVKDNPPLAGYYSPSRSLQKARTRKRIVEAARDQFAARGFDSTTIRGIADQAGVSAGTVISHFVSKIELLLAIMRSVNRAQLEKVRQTLPHHGAVCPRVMHMLRIYYSFDLEHPTLVAAVVGYSWRWGPDVEELIEVNFREGDELMRSILADGQRTGEVGPCIDLKLAVKIIFALYTRNLRHAVFDDLDAAEAADRLEPQIRLVIKGLASRPAS